MSRIRPLLAMSVCLLVWYAAAGAQPPDEAAPVSTPTIDAVRNGAPGKYAGPPGSLNR